MHRKEYLSSEEVRQFINWIEPKLDSLNSFHHVYCMKKPVIQWECHSIYSAFENYIWAFKHSDPVSNIIIKGKTFNDSFKSLQMLSLGLRKSIENGDNEGCRKYCYSILEWGGVLSKNEQRIIGLGDDICRYLNSTRDIFTSNLVLTDYYNEDIIMNSGFTKIYSLCIDDFIIYDGRVGAALGLLVRKFCEDSKLEAVPVKLRLHGVKGKKAFARKAVKTDEIRVKKVIVSLSY